MVLTSSEGKVVNEWSRSAELKTSRTLIILLAACAVTISEAVTEAACDAAVGQCQASALLQKGLKRAKVVASDSEDYYKALCTAQNQSNEAGKCHGI
eukprot:4823836-Amphidinium_carterae.1